MIAGGKGHGGCSWFLGGFLFGPLALIATIGLRDRKNDWNAQRLVATQEEMLEEMQRKHAWERRQWEREIERQYLQESYSDQTSRQLPPSDEFWEDEIDDEIVDIDAVSHDEDELLEYLHTLEYDEDVPELLEKLNALGIETKLQFLERLKWSCEILQGEDVETMFAKHIWFNDLNKSTETDYSLFWSEDLSSSFDMVCTQDNAYFLRKNYQRS